MGPLNRLLRRTLVVSPLKLAERALLARDWTSDQPDLFILGLPRSGTTLVYQFVVHRLRVAYFTSGVGRLPRSPCMVTRWERRRHGEYRSNFQSHYGSMAGAAAPHEAGEVWARWFGYEDYVRFDQLDPDAITGLRRTVACVQHAFGNAPFVNKNVKHLLRLDALARVFPRAQFLVVRRHLPDTALSVLRARHANQGDPRRWWSARPPDYEALKDLSPAAQVAGQLRSLQRRLDQDLAALPAGRVHAIDYADFCREPESLIERIRPALGNPAFRQDAVPPFEVTTSRPRTDEERALLHLLDSP
jgi:hypothetical protein